MSRIYYVPLNVTLTTAGGNTDIFSLQPADDKPIRIRGIELGQTSERGDSAEEGVRVTIKRLPATFTVGSGGASVTAAPPVDDSGGAVWGFTARTNDTTVATTTGTTQVLSEIGWNVRNTPYEKWFPDDPRFNPYCIQGQGLVVVLEDTLIDDMTFVGGVWVEEM